jgi:hypothetical protein
MFKKSILFILSIISCLSSIAQIPFPTGAAIWTERRGQGEAPHVWHVMEQRNEVLSALGYNYKKLYSAQFPTTLVLIGGLREDAMHRIYYYDITSGTERKVYDFSLFVGDTIKSWGLTDMPLGIVHSIDTVTIGSVARKRISFRQLTDTARWTLGEWVEGIGNTGLGGLLANPMLQPTCDCGINTLCFIQADTNVYHNPNYPTYLCLPVLTEVDDLKTATNTIQLYPNPVQSSALFVTLQGTASATVHIYDLKGSMIYNNSMSSGKQIHFSQYALPVGIYLYSITDDKGMISNGKLLVE